MRLPLLAQPHLQKEYNIFRSEDVLIKQQVKYKHPGRAGADVLWDFSKQESVDKKYTLSYSQSDSLVIGREHRTLYKYLLRNDSLYSLGYENPTTLMTNAKPELLLTFPFTYQKRIESYFYGTGNYCHRLDMVTQGKSVTTADAYGMILLPNGDTLQNVLRVRTVKKLAEKMTPCLQKDSLYTHVVNLDSINYHLNNDSTYMQVETYRWYSEGYRYPIFETIESTLYKRSKPFTHFNTAFFYSPDKHSYLNDDPKNLAKLEELDKVDKEKHNKPSGNNGNKNSNSSGNSSSNNETIHYNAYIEHGSNQITLEYNLTTSAEITIALYDMQGRLLASYPKTTHPEGYYKESISLDGFRVDAYLLRIGVNDKIYGEKIVK